MDVAFLHHVAAEQAAFEDVGPVAVTGIVTRDVGLFFAQGSTGGGVIDPEKGTFKDDVAEFIQLVDDRGYAENANFLAARFTVKVMHFLDPVTGDGGGVELAGNDFVSIVSGFIENGNGIEPPGNSKAVRVGERGGKFIVDRAVQFDPPFLPGVEQDAGQRPFLVREGMVYFFLHVDHAPDALLPHDVGGAQGGGLGRRCLDGFAVGNDVVNGRCEVLGADAGAEEGYKKQGETGRVEEVTHGVVVCFS